MPSSDAIRDQELSPAQIGRYTEAVDVWAVGILCFECLSGGLHASDAVSPSMSACYVHYRHLTAKSATKLGLW